MEAMMPDLSIPDPPCEFSLPLKPERLLWQLDVLDWSDGDLSRRVGIRSSKVSAWVNGRSFVPNQVAEWLEDLAQRTVSAGIAELMRKGPDRWQGGKDAGAAYHGLSADRKQAERRCE
jgi:hypothetical protein